MLGFTDSKFYWRKQNNSPRGCYVLQFRDGVFIAFTVAIGVLTAASYLPFNVGAIIVYIALGVTLISTFVTCLDSVYKMYRSLNQWRVLANIYTALCEGVFNMKFSNNWINGTLYFPKFMVKKEKINQTDGSVGSGDLKYDSRLIATKTEDDNEYFYYRSCPFGNTGFESQNGSIDITPTPACKGINFPTTIVDLE